MRKISILFKGVATPLILEADLAEKKEEVLSLYRATGDGPTTAPGFEEVAKFNWYTLAGYYWQPAQHEGE